MAGVISVTIPRASLTESILRFIGPVELGLVLASIVVALVFVKITIIKPIRFLTAAAHGISVGWIP